MSYVSFYRKWRPQKFSEVIGQEHIIQTLQNSIIKNKISHSYIFCGPRGTGKTSLARIFSKALNCENGPSSEPCNKCDNCTSITAGINVDVIEIDAASNRGIDDIRELRDKVRYLPVNLRKKVYIIDEAHQITTAAFNAFLKVLEEPPEHVVFILATTEPHEVISTIMSRCQRFDFEPVPVSKIKKRISEISSNEKIDITDSAIDLIAKHADGSLRDADGILEQLSSFGDTKITVDDVISLLGIIDREMLFELTNIILEKNLSQAILFTKRIISSGLNLKIFSSEYIEHLYNLFVIKNYENPLDILDITEEAKEKYFNQASLISSDDLTYLIDLFTSLFKDIKISQASKIFFKTAILKAVDNKSFIPEKNESQYPAINRSKDMEIVQKHNRKQDDTPTAKIEKAYVAGNENKKEPEIENDKNYSEEKKVKSTTDNDPGIDPGADPEKKLKDNWEKILSQLKNKNISIHAMFKETRSFKIINNTIYFYLDENMKWHKEHLSKNNNLMLVQELLKSVAGINAKIVFDFVKKNEKEAEKLSGNNIEEDAYRYFEKKFKING
jgi:DNA polymerase III subunit gamma/tau